MLAFDNNEWSISNARENIDLNEMKDVITLAEGNLPYLELPISDGIAANLNRNVIIESFVSFASAVKDGDCLLVSGILIYDKDEIIEFAASAGFSLSYFITEEEWIGFKFIKYC
ncbi:MAG: hypothetical protein HW421_2652 [Ignavibacteria bacterium]|nr:hypothetical protein [Ignavibacteria bacterium]